MKKIILLLLVTSAISAKTILISDIDDTIKIAHIRSNWGKVFNAFRTTNIFLGMADIYKQIQIQQKAEIFYISNAPEKLMLGSHTRLISNGDFPSGKILLRPNGVSDKTFKTVALERTIKEQNPDRVILFGDNGEHDANFYGEIERKYPNIEFITFIRIAYDLSHSLVDPTSDQYAFTTPFEIADILVEKEILTTMSLLQLYQTLGPAYLAEKKNESSGPLYQPQWQSCEGHEVNFSQLTEIELTRNISDKINSNCNSKD